jgi:hypothetical protein
LAGHPAAALATEEKAIKSLKPVPQSERKMFNERLQRYRQAADAMKNDSGRAPKRGDEIGRP